MKEFTNYVFLAVKLGIRKMLAPIPFGQPNHYPGKRQMKRIRFKAAP